MFDHDEHEFDTTDRTPRPKGKLSANGQWVFGSVYAGLALVGFSFGVWAGASKPKPVEVAEVKKDNTDKPANTTPVPAAVKLPAVDPQPKPPEPEPEPKVMVPDPKPPEPEPEPKPPEPKPEPKVVVKPPEPKPVKMVSFKQVEPIFRSYCNNCHGAVKGAPKGGVDLRTVAAIMKGGGGGDIVVPGMPDKSFIYLTIKEKTMPPEGKGPTPAELQLIHDWVAAGAKPRRRPVRGRRPKGSRLTPDARLSSRRRTP